MYPSRHGDVLQLTVPVILSLKKGAAVCLPRLQLHLHHIRVFRVVDAGRHVQGGVREMRRFRAVVGTAAKAEAAPQGRAQKPAKIK